jgi:hypothetical protein
MSEVKKIKVEILKSPSGRFLLPYSVGEKVQIEADLAEKIIKAKYAKKTR